MNRLWRRLRPTTVISSLLLCVALVLVLFLLWRASAPGDSGTQLGTFATAVSAFAALGAALASWRSAVRSDETARRAAEAVGMSIQPDVRADLIGRITLGDGSLVSRIEVRNHSIWPAANVIVLYDSGEGWTRKVTLRRLDAGHLPAGDGYPEQPNLQSIEVPLTPEPWTPAAEPEWDSERRIVETTTVEFEDERGFVRWRRTEKYERTYMGRTAAGGGMLSTTLEKVS